MQPGYCKDDFKHKHFKRRCRPLIISLCILTHLYNNTVYVFCTSGVLEGIPHLIPEHFLLPRPNDWTILVSIGL